MRLPANDQSPKQHQQNNPIHRQVRLQFLLEHGIMTKPMKNFFKADASYSESLQSFTVQDSFIAIAYYVFNLVLLYIAGIIFVKFHIYIGLPCNFLLILIPVIICRQSLSSIGITKRNLKPSIIVSCILGLLLLMLYAVVPGVINHNQWLPIQTIAYNIFYFFIIIAFTEELGFRGFIQPRLTPLFKSEWLTIVIVGVLFVFMHYPFQMARHNKSFVEYWPQFIAAAPLQFMWHFVFTWLYRRYGNIFGSTILHGFLDLTTGLFVG